MEKIPTHEFMYKLLLSGVLEQYYQIPPENSWMIATAEKNLPLISRMGRFYFRNIFASYCIKKELSPNTMKNGIEYMMELANYYSNEAGKEGIGFQIGGGIAGDFPICVVPMLYQDLENTDTPFWSYFCQIVILQQAMALAGAVK